MSRGRMSAAAAGRLLAGCAVVAAVAVALLVLEQGTADGILVALTIAGVVGGAVLVLADLRRGRATGGPGQARGRGSRPGDAGSGGTRRGGFSDRRR